MNKFYNHLLIISIVSLSLVLSLYLKYRLRLSKSTYNFTRTIPQRHIKSMLRFNLRYNSYYIAGKSKETLYLGNYSSPLHLLKIDMSLKDTQSIFIKIDTTNFKSKGLYKNYISADNFQMLNGSSRSILQGKVGIWLAKPSRLFIPFFNEAIQISDRSTVFRYVSDITHQNSLRKQSINGERIENEKILEKQVDGLFCTSGMLAYSKELQRLIYTYFYRNQILLLDTNLNLIKKLQTIDPVAKTNFTASEIKSNGNKVLTKPPLLVNAKSSVWRNYLFIESRLMGKHEDDVTFSNSTVIDIYDLKNYKYIYSIYLPNQDRKPIHQFVVADNYIYTICDQYINRYTVKLPES